MHAQKPVQHTHSRIGSLVAVFLGASIAAVLAIIVVWNTQAILDWWRLRNYTPDARVVLLTNETTMTDTARHLFYVNHPQILSTSAFSTKCKIGAEKTVVLGCYQSGDQGIYLYDVTDQRLRGVVETTAAHEMLHAAYNRMTKDEKTHIDALLTAFYANGLTDERVKKTIEAYRQSEPDELSNEMHSIFATEVAALPTGLESYYKKYFSDRATVVTMAQHYQAEFTSRRDKTVAYDTQLTDLKKKIDTNQANSTVQRRNLDSEYSRLQSLRRSGDDSAYNQLVVTYNAHVETYNSLLSSIKSQINQYNQIVEARNAVAVEERDLAKALSGDSSTQ